MSTYLGDYAEDATLDFKWSTNAADGASITRATDGTISVYKANSVTQSTAGITDTEDFDSLTGIHHCRIDLSADAFYATGSDYQVVLSAATIDGKTVNAVLAHFSIQKRYFPASVGIGVSGTALANLENFFDATGYAASTSTIGTATAVTNEVTANVTKIGGSSANLNKLAAILAGATTATAVTGTLTATSFTTSLTEATNGHYNDRIVLFTSGVLAGQGKLVTNYTGATKLITCASLTEAPGNGDAFILL